MAFGIISDGILLANVTIIMPRSVLFLFITGSLLFSDTICYIYGMDMNIGQLKKIINEIPDDYTISLESSVIRVPDGDDRIGTMYSSGRYSVDSRCSQIEGVSVDADCKDATIRLSLLLEEE